MAYRLAEQSGEWDVDALMDRVTIGQLREWMAFWEVQRDEMERSRKKAKAGKTKPGQQEFKDWRDQKALFTHLAQKRGSAEA